MDKSNAGRNKRIGGTRPAATLTLLLAAILSACETGGGGSRTVSVSGPGASRICNDYGSTRTCSGDRYNLTSPYTGRVIRKHEGIDIEYPPGTAVYSASFGKVVQTFRSRMMCGGTVVVAPEIYAPHPKNGGRSKIYVRYNHIVPRDDIYEYDRVKPGDLIGYVQDPAKTKKSGCIGPTAHLHFSMDHDIDDRGLHVNPHLYWADGPGKITCLAEGITVPEDKIVWPFAC